MTFIPALHNNKFMAISLISIIVPVYKVEKYLRQCLDSVISQTFQDWEMILIDDGSPDHCGDICDEYALQDKRIKVVHQENGGLSVARNVGIAKASGEYIYLLDSDDYLPPNSLSDLIEVAQFHNWPDYIKGNHLVLKPDGQLVTTGFARRREMFEGKKLGSNVFLSKVLLQHPLVWNGLIRRNLLQAYRLAFIPEAWPREDLLFHLSLAKCKWGVYTSKLTYVYRLAVANSLSNSISLKTIKNHIYISKGIIESIDNLTDIDIVAIAKQELAGTVNSFFKLLPRINLCQRNEYVNLYKSLIRFDVFKFLSKQLSPLTSLFRYSPIIYLTASRIIYLVISKKKRIT